MKRFLLIFLTLIELQLFSQNNNIEKNLIYSMYNNDSIFLKADITIKDSNIFISITVENNSKREIYIDTSYIRLYTLRDSMGKFPDRIIISHLEKDDVISDYAGDNMNVFVIKPSNRINKKFNVKELTHNTFLGYIKFYSLTIKYLNSVSLPNKYKGKSNFSFSKLSYYFQSESYSWGNCDLKFYLQD